MPNPCDCRLRCTFALAIVVLVGSPAIAARTFVTVATSSAFGGLGLSTPSINNNGTVAFVDTSPGTNGIYTGSGGPLTTIVTSQSYFAFYLKGFSGQAPSINDAGVVAFWANTGSFLSPSTGILSGTQSGLNTIVSGPPPVGTTGSYFYNESPQISGTGTVAFSAYRVGGSPGAGAFTGNGGPVDAVISTDTEIRGVLDPAISRNGIIAYEWLRTGQFGGSIGDNLYTLQNGVTTPIASTDGVFFNSIAVNDSGTVVASSEHAVHVGNGGPFTTFTDSADGFGTFGAVSINDQGTVAFAGLVGAGWGIFTGADAVLDKVIEPGDPLAGSTVTRVAFGRSALNDHGEIAFWAELATGQQGIFIASPVPEPSSIALIGIGGLGLIARRWCGRRRWRLASARR